MRTLRFLAGFAALALAACAAGPDPDPIIPQTPAPSSPRYEAAVAAIETADREAMPPKCATLFVGSSSIARWTTLKEDFPDRTVINRGVNGATVWEMDAYFNRLVRPHKPKEIVFYAGDNDLAAGRTPDDVYADFAAFMRMKNEALGNTPVYFIAIKPSILRWNIQNKMTEVNLRIREMAERRDDLLYVDVVTPMLTPSGLPRPLYVEDNLHMTPEGYVIWRRVVGAALARGQKSKAPGC